MRADADDVLQVDQRVVAQPPELLPPPEPVEPPEPPDEPIPPPEPKTSNPMTPPVLFEYLTLLNPVRYFMEMVRGIFLKGLGVADLWSHFLILGIMAAIVVFGAGKRFKKSLE